MDDTLRQRLALYEAMDDTPDGVVDFVREELERLEPRFEVTEQSAGALASHLIAALGRMIRRDPDIDPPGEIVYREVVTHFPSAIADAAAVSGRAERSLGVALSPIEQQYLSLHLGTLALTSTKEQS
ncbi:hypothetical protein BHE97_11850 [Aeromicrobium sp. PE09-221]|uniref:hypothetical protein n=1 Tax=Aeromicrobium sp. PE09-221 TaxID=1898043 RepID=UPI000B3E9769|nr:hypothetical protein [Aeromicrobium sp. PE09-221]OUZ09047.1 hypothetical protein BHE97_11850 [Aeromicrobium sp. PE09-221]